MNISKHISLFLHSFLSYKNVCLSAVHVQTELSCKNIELSCKSVRYLDCLLLLPGYAYRQAGRSGALGRPYRAQTINTVDVHSTVSFT